MSRPNAALIAIVGSGVIGPRHAQSVVACHAARLHCFVDPRPETDAIAATYNVPRFASIEQMLQQSRKPDAAIVCTPNTTHVELALELLDAGVHVLVEKPISTDIASGRRLVQSARRSGKQLMVGHHRRFNPHITATKSLLVDHAIGRPIAISGLWVLHKPAAYFEPPLEWHAQRDAGGPILINLIHEVDVLQFLLGPITRVHAEQTLTQRGFDVEEGAAILLKFQSGVVGTFIISDAAPSLHNFESGTGENPLIPRAGMDFYRIFGSDGTLSVGDMKLTVDKAGPGKSWSNALRDSDVPVAKQVPFDEQLEHFVRVIRGRDSPVCTGEDGLAALIVCDAVKRAVASGNAIDIDV